MKVNMSNVAGSIKIESADSPKKFADVFIKVANVVSIKGNYVHAPNHSNGMGREAAIIIDCGSSKEVYDIASINTLSGNTVDNDFDGLNDALTELNSYT